MTLTELRHDIHAHPDLSGQEERTREQIRSYLAATHPTTMVDVGGTGLLALYDSGVPGKTLLVRAELDGLPIEERNNLPYQSTRPNHGHLCGHDGHMTLVAGIGEVLNQKPPDKGRVLLLFQPAEETGEGAQWVLDDPAFADFQPDCCVALHNVPGFPLGSVVVREGIFTPSVESVTIQLDGKTAHAAEPELGINPAWAIQEILALASELRDLDPNSETYRLVTPVEIQLGEKAFGTSAGHGSVSFTLRAWTKGQFDNLKESFTKKVTAICDAHGLQHSWEWIEPFFTTRNDEGTIRLIREVAEQQGRQIIEKDMPFRWGEDFGRFTQAYTGAMFGLGSGEQQPALHNPDFDFPDDLLPIGLQLFAGIIHAYCNDS